MNEMNFLEILQFVPMAFSVVVHVLAIFCALICLVGLANARKRISLVFISCLTLTVCIVAFAPAVTRNLPEGILGALLAISVALSGAVGFLTAISTALNRKLQ